MSHRACLAVRVDRLNLTRIEPPGAMGRAPVLVLCPQIAWAAGLREFAFADLCTRRCRVGVRLLLGAAGEARLIAADPGGMKPNTPARLLAYARRNGCEPGRHSVTFVRLGRKNLPIEIRQGPADGTDSLPVPGRASAAPAIANP